MMDGSAGEQQPRIRIVVSDMEEKVQHETVQAVEKIFQEEAEKGANVKEVASRLKSHLDASHGKRWHVVVGSSFGSAVDALSSGFLHFYYGDLAFLVFRTA